MKSVKRLFHSNNITCSLKILCLIYRKTMLIFCLFKFKPCIFNAYLHITNNELTLHTLDVQNYPLITRGVFYVKVSNKNKGLLQGREYLISDRHTERLYGLPYHTLIRITLSVSLYYFHSKVFIMRSVHR